MRKVLLTSLLLLPLVALRAAALDKLVPPALRDVKCGGEIGRRIEVTITNNLLVLDADRDFLPPFRAKQGKESYIGLGKLIDATAKLSAFSSDARVLALKKHLIEETIKTQEADGYIGIFPEGRRVTSLWDVHETGYVIWGLLTDYRLFGEERSLAAARKAAEYLVKNWSALPENWGAGSDVAPHVAFTGLERTMLAMGRETREPSFHEFCTKTRALPEWDLGIVIGRRSGIEGHVYAYLARCLAQLELHRTQPDSELLRPVERALDFMTHRDGMMITGSSGQCEIWTADQDGRGDVGETCALAYQIRVWESLLRMKGDPRMGDLMDRTIFNALFASQSPDGRRLRYFAPLEGSRAYWHTDTYCCPCNFRRIIAELPAMIFYRSQDGIAVNLYSPSEVKLVLENGLPVIVRQTTDYPNSGRIGITIDPSSAAKFTLSLRIPSWATNASVVVNGEPAKGAVKAGTFFEIRREWKSGDQVALDLPMQWRLVKGRQRQAGRVALMRGPQVFCLNPAQNPNLAKLDGTELGYLAIDPDSLAAPVANTAVRPDGLACRVAAWKPGFGLAKKSDYELTLTEFPDPDGKATYFRVRDFSCAVDDELLSQ